ncbi:lysylphosphatidylglycerol synthase domain-containing protein [Gemmatimonas sp.]|uniref:lysylphosphatidylglycerol synthase domain-containing protein n=1 Tax=Gemmatimonas sp. TaxID=1962908 RepID=UPI0037C029BA
MSLVSVLRKPLVRWLLLAITFGFIAWGLSRQWTEVEQSVRSLDIRWPWVLAASGLVLATYAMLIQSWRMLLAGWGGHLPYGKAAQIWTVANLGRYLPGKVWSITALGVLSSRAGVSGVAAAGASVLGTLLNIGAGFGVSVIFGGPLLDAVSPGLQRVSLVTAVIFVLGVLMLPFLLPLVLDRFARWRGLPLAEQHLRNRDVWSAALLNSLAWVGYGVAFACFARGVLPLTPNITVYIAVYAASYLVGFLALFAPGGIGFRELALSALLVAGGAAGQGDAAVLGATSRIWLTVLEVLPGLIGLLLMTPKDRADLSQGTSR